MSEHKQKAEINSSAAKAAKGNSAAPQEHKKKQSKPVGKKQKATAEKGKQKKQRNTTKQQASTSKAVKVEKKQTDGKEAKQHTKQSTSKDISRSQVQDEIKETVIVADDNEQEAASVLKEQAKQKQTEVSSPVESHNEEKQQTEASASMTLEEKRKKQRENKMTIEERRKLQREDPDALHKKVSLLDYIKTASAIDYIFMAILFITELLNLYFSVQVMRYFKAMPAVVFFVIVTLLLFAILRLSVRKRKWGYVCNSIMAILLIVCCIFAYRGAQFSDKVFDNTESETVMIVAKKDSALEASSDFSGKKLATVKFESDINEFAQSILSDNNKHDYITQEFRSYQEAYDSLMDGKSDMMVYTMQTQQRLDENDNHSGDHIKVLFERKRQRKAVQSKNVDITKEPFNVLVSGVDLTSKDINEKGSSDVNILLTVNPKTKKLIMQTIPRDSWAPLTCVNDQHTKLTYAGAYGGVDCSINTIEKMYGITINYYAKINFQGVMDLVDALGGITVNNDIAFCTPYKDRYDVNREVCFNVGENRIDGSQALIYSRIRQIFTDGDIERGRHQMEVINAVVREFKKAPSMSTINSLLGAVENNFTTNLTETDIVDALSLFLSMKDQLNEIKTYTMEGEMLWNNDEITNEYLYYFYPKDGEVNLVKQRIQDIMNGK